MLARVRRGLRACFRTRRRAQLSVLVLAACACAGWYGVKELRTYLAVRDAEKALARYDFPTARRRLELATRLTPQKPTAWLLGAQAARRDGALDDARTHLVRYEQLVGTQTPEGKLESSLQQVQRGEIERNVYPLMTMADASHPATEQILEALAAGSVQAYHVDRTGFWVHHLLTRFPKNPVGRLIHAQQDDMLGKRDRATTTCRELVADFPDNWRARLLLAGLLLRANQFDEAAAEYEVARRQRPNDLSPLLGLARSRDRQGRADEARALMKELEQRFPDTGEVLLDVGRLALKEDRPADAERVLRRAVEVAPNDHEIRYHYGLCLERLGRPDEAKPHFERFKQIEADMTRLHELLEAVVKSPRDPAPRREAGLICLRNGETTEGLRWLQGALEVAPDDPATRAALDNYYRGQKVR